VSTTTPLPRLTRALPTIVVALTLALGAVGVALALLTCSGCARVSDAAIVSLNSSQVMLTAANEALADMHRHARDEAVAEAATETDARARVDRVHERYRRAWDAYDAARAAWLAAAAATQAAVAADAAHEAPNEAELTSALLALSKAMSALKVAADSVKVVHEDMAQGGAL